MSCRLIGPTCIVHACLRPVREYGGYCTPHWMGLSPAQRWALQQEVTCGDTKPIDPLELAFRLPSYGETA